MAIIGCKRIGWSKSIEKRKWELLIQFDDEVERDSFEKIIEAIQAVIDWNILNG